MDKQPIDIDKVTSLLSYIKQLSDDGITSSNVEYVVKLLENIKPFFKWMVLEGSFPELTRLTINRNVIKKNERLSKIENIKYPKPEIILKYGRCNKPKQSIFYAGFIKPTILMELNPDVGDLITTSTWKIKDDRKMVYCPIFLNQPTDGTLNPDSFILEQTFDKSIKLYSEEERKLIRYVNQFVADEFSKEVKSSNGYEYFLSAYFSNIILYEVNRGKIDAILYPSVKDKLSSGNIAIKPNVFEKNYILYEVTESIMLNKIPEGNHILLEEKGITRTFDFENDDIKWYEACTYL